MLSLRQLIVLGVALAAAVGAALLIGNMSAPAPPAPEAAQEATGQQVLVAVRDVPQGSLLSAADLQWRRLPDDAIGPTFITETAHPDALTEFVGAVNLRPLATNEPLQDGALVKPGDGGMLAAQVALGYRAVAVMISEESAAGGYIQPNDRVDVILTVRRPAPAAGGGSGFEIISDVILELSQEDSRTVARAEALAQDTGGLRLVLRGVQSEPPGLEAPSAQRWRAASLEQGVEQMGGVRVHSFGEEAR
jgi:pilus assembly protein CpaB